MSFPYRVKSYATPTKKQKKDGEEEKNVVSSQALRRTQKLRFDEVDVDSAEFVFNSRGLVKPRKSPAKPTAALPVKSNSPSKRSASDQLESSSSPKRGRGRPPAQQPEKLNGKEEEVEEEKVESFPAIVLSSGSKKNPLQRLIFPVLASEAKNFQESEDSEEWLENSCNECARIFLESVAAYPKEQINSLLKTDGSLRQPARKLNPEAQSLKKREDSLNLLIKSYEKELEVQEEIVNYYSKKPKETPIFLAPSQASKIPKLGEKKGRKSISKAEMEKEEGAESDEFNRQNIFEQLQKISFESNEMRSTLSRIQKKVEDNEESYKTWAEFLKREGFKDFDLGTDPRSLIKELTQPTPTATPATTPATTPFRSNNNNEDDQHDANQSPGGFRTVFNMLKDRLF